MRRQYHILNCLWLLSLLSGIRRAAGALTLGPYGRMANNFPIVNYKQYKSEAEEKDNNEYGVVDTLWPLYALANSITGGLVNDRKEFPDGYIVGGGNASLDIDHKVETDDWADYLAQQPRLLAFVVTNLVMLLLAILAGILYCVFCSRCRRSRHSGSGIRIYYSVMLAILVLLMLLPLIIVWLSCARLKKSFEDSYHSRCSSGDASNSTNYAKSLGNNLHHLYVDNYLQFQNKTNKIFKSEPAITQSYVDYEAKAAAIDEMAKKLENLPKAKTLFAQLKNELPAARFIAIQFRDALRGVKRTLLLALTSQCSLSECKQFYRTHGISALDLGCLHYDTVPDSDMYAKSLEDFANSTLIDYARKASEQLRKMKSAIESHMNIVLDRVEENLYEGAQKLRRKNAIMSHILERAVDDMRPAKPEKRTQPPAYRVLRRKFGSDWYLVMVLYIVLLMLAPLLLLLGLLVGFSSRRIGSHILLAAILVSFVLFVLALVPILFFLMHGALLYHASCSRNVKSTVPDKEVDPNRYLPARYPRTRKLPVLRLDLALQRCDKNESLYKILDLEYIYDLNGMHDQLMENVKGSLQQMDNSSLPPDLGSLSLYSQASQVAEKLLESSNLSSFDVANFTRNLCLKLVPEPLPGLANKLDELAERIKDQAVTPLLRNQAIHLRSYHEHLGDALQKIVERILDALRHINELVTGGKGSMRNYIAELLTLIKQGEELLQRNATGLTNGVAQNVTKYLDSALRGYVDMVHNETETGLQGCSGLSARSHMDMDEVDMCKRIVKPINAIWFYLLLSSLLFLPAICLAHQLRCAMPVVHRTVSSDTMLVAIGGENFVHSNLIVTRPCQCHLFRQTQPEYEHQYQYPHQQQYHVSVSAPSNMEQLFGELNYGVEIKPKRE